MAESPLPPNGVKKSWLHSSDLLLGVPMYRGVASTEAEEALASPVCSDLLNNLS